MYTGKVKVQRHAVCVALSCFCVQGFLRPQRRSGQRSTLFYVSANRMIALIQQGVKKGIIKFDVENKYITYIHQDKKRNYQNPEEKVQAETFCKLVLEYGYPEKHIQQFVSVKMGVADKEADIIVYADEEFIKPLIIVECKSETITELEFQEAVKQAYSYAHALAGTTKFVF